MFASKDLFFTRPSGYQISRSVRLRLSASAYLNRTPAGAGTSNKTFTYSAWVKRGSLSSLQNLISSVNLTNSDSFRFTAADQIEYIWSDTTTGQVTTTQLFRDPSACYHVMFAMDTTQATAANRFKLYINGVQVTAFATASYPAQNTVVNNTAAVATKLGQYVNSGAQGFDGYLTEVNFIDGQALTPSSFGQYNANGVWSPIKYAGTYGTNGFYLNFSDNSASTATTIGKDYSGNGNNWTPNNISVTAGVTYDSMLDVPTLYADGGNGRGNYAVMNPLNQAGTATPTNGNLTVSQVSDFGQVASTIAMETGSGKWYYEHTITAVGGENSVGIGASLTSAGAIGNLSTQYGYYFTGGKVNNATNTAYGSSYTTGDVIGVAYDATAGSITFYKNNVSQGVAFTGITGTMFALACTRTSGGQNSSNLNFGQRPFTYTPPTGFVALNTQNLSTPTIKNGAAYMAATTYTGTGASLTIANTVNSASFQPDFVWVKARSSATNNRLYDSVRGANLVLSSNTTDAETTPGGTGGVTAFNSNGFSLGSAGADNASAVTFIGWQWKAGTTSSSNTSGSITSTVSVGATQGFSVVTYTGNGTNPGATIGHGLGVSPAMIITKSRSGTGEWPSYHVSIGVTNTLYLNATYASSTYVNRFSAVSSTTFTTGSSGGELNTNGVTYVAYCFAAVAGYSAFGSYTGNGSANGPFVYLGFRPKFVMIKQSNGVTNWSIKDSSVNTYNAAVLRLYPNTSGAETSGADLDYLSNGFKCRTTSNEVNAAGTYIYMAFAENPFKYSLAR